MQQAGRAHRRSLSWARGWLGRHLGLWSENQDHQCCEVGDDTWGTSPTQGSCPLPVPQSPTDPTSVPSSG